MKNIISCDKNNLLKSQFPFRFSSYCSFVFFHCIVLMFAHLFHAFKRFYYVWLGHDEPKNVSSMNFFISFAQFSVLRNRLYLGHFSTFCKSVFCGAFYPFLCIYFKALKFFCNNSFRRYVQKKSHFWPKTNGSAIKMIY